MIKNLSTKKIISQKEIYLTNYFQKIRGVLFRKKITKPFVFEFQRPTKEGIHMFFVFYNLIVIWVNKNNIVIKKVLAKPFRIYKCNDYAIKIIEMPESFNKKIQVGDYLKIN